MKARFVVLLVVLSLSAGAVCAWTTVGDGIEYQYFAASGPNNVFVCRLLRSNTNASLESYFANAKLYGGTQIVRNQAAILDDSISATWWAQDWGGRYDVICAVNGDFFGGTPARSGGQIHSGWYCRRMDEFGWSGFRWGRWSDAGMGGCVYHRAEKQLVNYQPNNVTVQFQGINRERGSDELVIYTPQWDANTHTDNSGSEVVLKLTCPLVIRPTPGYVSGTVVEIRQGLGSTMIPFDCCVLSATGSAETTLLNNVSVGSEVRVSQEITGMDFTCSTNAGPDWTHTFSFVNGNFVFLKDSVIRHTTDAGMTARNPRTCQCYNAAYVYLVVCDGRSAQSVGWTSDEMANFCVNTLGATDGVNLDGGGSSTMIVNGTLMNDPSDGSERAVANSYMMVNILPKQQSTTFTVGQNVTTNTTASLYLGPGTNFGVLTTIGSGQSGTILEHTCKGVLAKGANWWKVDFSGSKGWVTENVIGTAPPPIEIILDEDQGTYSGSWTLSTCLPSEAYNGDYKYATSAKTETAWYGWTPSITTAGNYDVYVMYRSGTNRTTKAPYTVYYNGGSKAYTVNQTANGGTWVLLGTHPFAAGTAGYVKLGNKAKPTGRAVIADAVRWVYVP